MNLWVDGSKTETCIQFEGQEPVVQDFASMVLPVTTNMAEYYALLRGLQEAQKQGFLDLDIYSDSQLMVNQINTDSRGNPYYDCKEVRLRQVRAIALALIAQFNKVTLTWIPRVENKAGHILERRYRNAHRTAVIKSKTRTKTTPNRK